MLVRSRVGQVFLIARGGRKQIARHYLVTSIRAHEVAWEAWHGVAVLETGETMELTESYLAMAENSGWRER